MFFVRTQLAFATLLCKFLNHFQNRNGILSRLTVRIIVFFINIAAKVESFPIISTDEYISQYGCQKRIIKSGRLGVAYGCATKENNYTAKRVVSTMADLTMSEIEDVYIHHNSDLVFSRNHHVVINDYCTNKQDDNQIYVDSITRGYFDRTIIVKRENSIETIEKGIMINGKYSFNYYHSLYENLIRILILYDYNELIPNDVPLVVDMDMMNVPTLKNIFEKLVGKINRDVRLIQSGKYYNVKRLYLFSDINHLVPNMKNSLLSNIEDYSFDEGYTKRLKDEILQYKSEKVFPKRFFITRKNTKRRNFNEDDVFEVLQQYGFVKIAPEIMPLEDQISLFNGAEIIVGGSGAAFTNMLFCSTGCHALSILSAPYYATCFNSPVYFNGATISYYSCDNTDNGIHASFVVDKNSFAVFFQEYMSHICSLI